MSAKQVKSLHNAIKEGHLHKVRDILQKDSDIRYRLNEYFSPYGDTLCHEAAFRGHADILKLLLEHGVNVNAVGKKGNTPLHHAAREGHVDILQLLLDHGANVNAVNKDIDTSLHYAARKGHVDILQLLLNHGANMNVINRKRDTLLQIVAAAGHVDFLQLLLNHGANINDIENDIKKAWLEASFNGHVDIMRVLLNHGATVNSVSRNFTTPLVHAVMRDDVDMLQLLLNHGANVNMVGFLGDTPLHWAATHRRLKCIKLLLKSGANIRAKNNDGETPYQIAIRKKHEECAQCLRNADNEEDEELMNSSQDDEEEEYRRAYSEALQEGEAKNNRIPIMLIGQDRAGKTSLMARLLGLPFNKDQPSTIGIDVEVIELTEQNAGEPWQKREVKEFMTNKGEAETVIYKKAAEYFDREVQRNSGGDVPEPTQTLIQETAVMPVTVALMNPLPVKPLSREDISKIKSQRSTQYDQKEILRGFVTDFAGQSIYYDTHGCFVKPHCPYVLVYDLSLEFDEPAVPRFKANEEKEEEEMDNPYGTTNLDNFTSWLKFLQGLGECQDQHFSDESGPCALAKGEKFNLPPVLIAFTHSDKVKGDISKIDSVQRRIKKVLSAGEYKNVFREFFLINNTLEGDLGDDVRKLRRKLFDLSKAVLEQEIFMPVKWLDFEAALSRKLSTDIKYIPVDEAKKEAENCGVCEFDQAIKFLHRLGAVVYHSGSSKVVLDPHWLMNLFTEVISIRSKVDPWSTPFLDMLKEKGILLQEYLKNKVSKDAELLEELMEKFNLICPCQYEGKAAFYVPSVAPSRMRGEELEASTIPSLFVTFPRQLVPMSLFTKLQVKLISEWKKRFPDQQATPSFYCNYSMVPLIVDGNVYGVRLIDFHEFIKVTVFPKQDGNCSEFAHHFVAILKKCLNDLKSPDQLLFSMTSYELEVKCTCCFGKGKKKCSRHRKIQCDSDRCGHSHFWKLSDLQKFYKQSPAVCQSLCEVFDIKSVQIWLNTVPDAVMVEDSSQCGLSNEKLVEASTSDNVREPPELNCRLPALKDIGLRRYEWSSNEIQSYLPTDILLVTATDHEFNSCYSYMKEVRRSWSPNGGMVDFGEFGDQRVKAALIRCQLGPLPALIVVNNAAEDLKPKVVLCVGVCATVNRAKAKLGDVVISARLATYASKKITSDGKTERHGIRTNVSRNLASLILSAADGWQPPVKEPSNLEVRIHRDGVMLSGPELVDNDERRQELLDDFPDAIGLEMEGEGLYSAAYDLGIEWAVIKGVADYADGNKKATEDWQLFASTMAASVVYNMFQYADVLKHWPRYNKPGATEGTTSTQEQLEKRSKWCKIF